MPLGDGPQFLPGNSQPAQAPNQNVAGITSSEELAGPGETISGANGTLSRNVTFAQSPFSTPQTQSGIAVVEVDTISSNGGNANVVVVSPPSPTSLQEWIVKCVNGAPGGPQAPILLRPDGVSATLIEDPSTPGTLRDGGATLASLKNGAGTSGRWYFDPGSTAWRLSSTM